MTIGFVGLGSQGGPMAAKLVEAGHEVMLWARRPASLDPYRGTAARLADNLADLGAVCEIVAICVVDDAGVQEVAAELLPVMKSGGIIVIHSTIHPQSCMALSERARSRRLFVVDAPVSGGGQAAAAGTLTVMVGGDRAAVGRVEPLFKAFAGLIVHLGGVGAGQTSKLINNALMAANMANAHHALCSADAAGVDRIVFAELIKASTGRSFGFEVCARQRSLASFSQGAKLLAKDVRLLGDVLSSEANAAALRSTANAYLDAVDDAARTAAT